MTTFLQKLCEAARAKAHDTHKEEYDQIHFFHYNTAEIDDVVVSTTQAIRQELLARWPEEVKINGKMRNVAQYHWEGYNRALQELKALLDEVIPEDV